MSVRHLAGKGRGDKLIRGRQAQLDEPGGAEVAIEGECLMDAAASH